MANCSICGRQTSFLRSICKQCEEEKTRQVHEKKISKLGESPAHCKMVALGVAWQPAILNLTVGDLFVTNEAIVLLGYSTCTYTGKLGGLVGFFAAGISGGIGASFANAQALFDAKDKAERARNQDYGMTIEDRLAQHNGIVIARKDVQSISADIKQRTMRINYQGAHIDLAIDVATFEKKLLAWLSGKLEDQEDVQGANLALPPCSKFLNALETHQGIPKDLLIQQISTNDNYLSSLWSLFFSLKETRQLSVVHTLLQVSDPLKQSLIKQIRLKREEAHKMVVYSLSGSSVGILGAIYLISNWSIESHGAMSFLGFLSFMACASFLVAAGLFLVGFSEQRYFDQLLKHLGYL